MALEITEIKIFPTKTNSSKIRAYVDVTFNDILNISGYKIIEGQRGLFLAAPSRQSGDKFYDIVRFVNAKEEGSPGRAAYVKLQDAAIKKLQATIPPQKQRPTRQQSKL